jgi:excisionase family DNA binding protein
MATMTPHDRLASPGPRPDKLLVGITQAAAMLSVGRSTVYRLVLDGTLFSTHVGTRRLIPVDELKRYIAALVDQSATASDPENG